jgi:hypothetical protein
MACAHRTLAKKHVTLYLQIFGSLLTIIGIKLKVGYLLKTILLLEIEWLFSLFYPGHSPLPDRSGILGSSRDIIGIGDITG